MVTGKDKLYLIAENVFESTKSRMLKTFSGDEARRLDFKFCDLSTLNLIKTIKSRIESTEFIGGGYKIDICRKIDSLEDHCLEDADDSLITLGSATHPEMFESIKTVAEFPLIDDSLVPGIYRIEGEGHVYCEVSDLTELTEICNEIEMRPLVDEYQIICFPDRIEMRSCEEDEALETVLWHPFTFFDFLCPFCRRKVLTYRVSGRYQQQCSIVANSCRHFIGHLVRLYGEFEQPSLEELNLNYQYFNGRLQLETAPGQWQEPYIIVPPTNPLLSYWNHHGNVDTQDEMLFLALP